MVIDVVMEDVTLEVKEDDSASVVKVLGSELYLLCQAVPHVDLRALARLKVTTLQKKLSPGLLKQCILLCVDPDGKESDLRDAMLDVLQGESLDQAAAEQLKAEIFQKEETAEEKKKAAEEKKKAEKEKKDADKSKDGGDKKDDKKDDDKKDEDAEKKVPAKRATVQQLTSLPETAFFFMILALSHACRKAESTKSQKDQALAQGLASHAVHKLRSYNRRTLDFLGSRVYSFLGRAYEDSEDLRNDFLAIYRTACLKQDFNTQATVLNLILRNFVVHNLHEQAIQFVSKTTFPEQRSNAEYARYLYYIGKTKSIQLEYSDAHEKLMMAIRKAPATSTIALGFKIAATKLAVLVELLMGDTPKRSTFLQPEMREQMKPYEEIVRSVRGGDLKDFAAVAAKHEGTFKKDGTMTLVNRLHYNVIKTGLRRINVCYKKITLKDVCARLGLESEEDACGICAKAILDGVIHATITYDDKEKCLITKASKEVYATQEPQDQFHKRIAFCLQLHNDCVKNMEYPSKKSKEEDDPSLRNKEIEDAVEAFSSSDEDDDMDLL